MPVRVEVLSPKGDLLTKRRTYDGLLERLTGGKQFRHVIGLDQYLEMAEQYRIDFDAENPDKAPLYLDDVSDLYRASPQAEMWKGAVTIVFFEE